MGFDGQGNAYAAGGFDGSITLGGQSVLPAGGGDLYLTSFTDMGVHRWSTTGGDASRQSPVGLEVTAADHVLVLAENAGEIDLGGGTVTSSGTYDAYLAAMSSNGQHLWSGGFGGSGLEFIRGLALGPAGEVSVVGYANGTVWFGGARLPSRGSTDMFVFTVGP